MLNMSRFHTIMAYYCAYNAPDGYEGAFVPGINYFSNPNVNYQGRATGTGTENNARTITENMVRRKNGVAALCAVLRPCLSTTRTTRAHYHFFDALPK